MGDFLSDLRYSFRMLIGSPAFTVTVDSCRHTALVCAL